LTSKMMPFGSLNLRSCRLVCRERSIVRGDKG
jgi:hypothetical protein